MWTGQEMTLVDGLMISAVGLLVVFAALAALAIAVIIISKIINTAVKDKAPKQAAVAAAAPSAAAVVNWRRDFVRQSPAAKTPGQEVVQSSPDFIKPRSSRSTMPLQMSFCGKKPIATNKAATAISLFSPVSLLQTVIFCRLLFPQSAVISELSS